MGRVCMLKWVDYLISIITTIIIVIMTIIAILRLWRLKKGRAGEDTESKGSSHGKKTVKKGEFSPFGRPPPPLNGSKGDICCLITDKSA